MKQSVVPPEPEDDATTEDKAAQASDANQTQTSKSKPGRRKLPAHLPRFKVYHTLDDTQTLCACGCQMQAFDELVSEQLGIIPATLYVIQHCRKKYSCRQCQHGVKTAPMPAQPIPKSNASPELLAHITVSKFLDGLPFYRQEKIWERLAIALPRATQASWTMASGVFVQPLINLLREQLFNGPVMHIDETTVQVLKEPDRPPDGKKYFWVQAGGPPDQPVLLFHYDPSRGTAVASSLIQDYRGVVLSDDWHIYERVCNRLGLTHIACNDHARRKFKDAKAAEPAVKGKKHKTSKADMALGYYRKLYAIERRIKALPADEKYRIRQAESVPVWQAFKVWLDKSLPYITPASKLGKAIHYTHKLWAKLTHYCKDGHLPISNERAENAIRPFAIARKNFLFFDTPKGATASANLYSLIMTAKANGVDPFYYLAHVFKELPRAQTLEDIEALLPWRVDGAKIKHALVCYQSPVC